MADEQQALRKVSWNEVFSFPQIFKSFKMAVHPSKLLLALLAIALTWAIGRVVMDPIWSGASETNRVPRNEAWALWTAPSRSAFLEAKKTWREETRVFALQGMVGQLTDFVKLEEGMTAKKDFEEVFELVGEGSRKAYEAAVEDADKAYSERVKQIGKEDAAAKTREEKKEEAKEVLLAGKRTALTEYIQRKASLSGIRGGRIFASFLDWQGYCLANAFSAVTRARFTAGVGLLYRNHGSMTPVGYGARARQNRPDFVEAGAVQDPERYGLLAWLMLMAWGVSWMFWMYPVYTIIYVVVALALWALLGGAICRIAALHAAREEKISMVAAVKFSLSKFLSFFGAPLLPLGFIIFLGFCIALAGLVGAIPWVGEWLFALLFFLPLLAGLICAFLTIGLVGGSPLMWPTIAVEGSDGFDALSRSFSYVFARPFRYGFYWLAAAVYGTICYLFVRLFAFISLRTVHHWAGWWMRADARPEYATGGGKLDVMWAQPTFSQFHGPMQWEAMNGSEAVAATILMLWVYLVSAVVLAFLACFVFSAATNIYFILRQKVDATDLDDVYVEEIEEAEAPPEEQPAEEAPAEEAPAEEAPAEEEPGEEEGGEKKSE